MRSVHGQLSDNQPIRRSLEEKQRQLRDLKETRAALTFHPSPDHRASVRKRITQVTVELAPTTVL